MNNLTAHAEAYRDAHNRVTQLKSLLGELTKKAEGVRVQLRVAESDLEIAKVKLEKAILT